MLFLLETRFGTVICEIAQPEHLRCRLQHRTQDALFHVRFFTSADIPRAFYHIRGYPTCVLSHPRIFSTPGAYRICKSEDFDSLQRTLIDSKLLARTVDEGLRRHAQASPSKRTVTTRVWRA